METLYGKLMEHGKSDSYPFHMPGHKRNRASVDMELPLQWDITEIDGFDNLHHAEGILRASQERAAKLFGAKETLYSVNGSTAALLSAVSASVKRGGRILVARNCHRAVYHGIYLRDLDPVYLYPGTGGKTGVNGSVPPEEIRRLLSLHPEAEAVLITSPTYDGVVSDVKQIAAICHEHGLPLIVDEAHGAHFCFSGYFPASAVELGADVVVQSVHKTLPSMTQTALLHRCSSRVDAEKLRQFMGIYQTSSPSYILMASIDACMDKLANEGKSMFTAFTEELEATRRSLEPCRYIRLITEKELLSEGAFAYDRSKLLFSTAGSSLNGHGLAEILRNEFDLEVEMEAENYALALAAVGDSPEGFARLCRAIREIDRREEQKCGDHRPDAVRRPDAAGGEVPVIKMRIADALESRMESCPLADSEGKISGEFACLYPPGVPLLVPGEEITGHLIRNMRRYREQGLSLQGMKDVSCGTIQVVKERRS